MRPSNKQRSRNKPGNNGNQHNQQRRPNMGNVINRVFESAGPDGKVRGTPQQIIDKYQMLARDAQLAGDRVAAENYLQHAEHYSRLLGDAQRQQAETRFSQERDEGQRGDDSQRDDGQRDDGHREDGPGQQPQAQPQPQPQPQQRFDDSYDQPRRQPAMAAPVASGLAMIEPDDSFDMSGPIETPEGRRAQSDESRPIVQPAPQLVSQEAVNGAGHPAVEASAEPADASSQPAKRPRPRRRAKPAEVQASEPVPQAD